MADVAEILREEYKGSNYKIPKRKIPGFVLRIGALFDRTLSLAVGDLGLRQDISSKKIRSDLNFNPKSLNQMVIDMAESMIKFKVV